MSDSPCGCIPRTPYVASRRRRFTGCVTDIDAATAMTWFEVVASYADHRAVALNPSAVRMDISRKGRDEVLAAYQAFAADTAGRIGFYWDGVLYALAAGWYVGDVYMHGEYCVSVLIRIPRCAVEIINCEPESAGSGCQYDYCSPLGLVAC